MPNTQQVFPAPGAEDRDVTERNVSPETLPSSEARFRVANCRSIEAGRSTGYFLEIYTDGLFREGWESASAEYRANTLKHVRAEKKIQSAAQYTEEDYLEEVTGGDPVLRRLFERGWNQLDEEDRERVVDRAEATIEHQRTERAKQRRLERERSGRRTRFDAQDQVGTLAEFVVDEVREVVGAPTRELESVEATAHTLFDTTFDAVEEFERVVHEGEPTPSIAIAYYTARELLQEYEAFCSAHPTIERRSTFSLESRITIAKDRAAKAGYPLK